jgi:signal peptidase I
MAAHPHSSDGLSRGRLISYGAVLVICLILLYFLAFRGLQVFMVPSRSMEPTLRVGDYLMTLKADPYNRGDIVVLRDPEHEGDYLVKRLIGLPGDEIEVAFGRLLINKSYISEPYTAEPMGYDFGPYVVPDGHAVFLGDNRNESDDSSTWKDEQGRAMPSVPLKSIVGKVRYRYLPFARMGPVSSYPLLSAEPL